jgi:hypothetical protein
MDVIVSTKKKEGARARVFASCPELLPTDHRHRRRRPCYPSRPRRRRRPTPRRPRPRRSGRRSSGTRSACPKS